MLEVTGLKLIKSTSKKTGPFILLFLAILVFIVYQILLKGHGAILPCYQKLRDQQFLGTDYGSLFHSNEMTNLFILGLVVGVIGAMLLLNIILYVRLKDKNHLLLVLFLFPMLLLQLCSINVKYELFHVAFINLTLITAIAFSRSYLEIKDNLKKWDKALKMIMLLPLSGIALYLISFKTVAGIVSYGMTALVLLVLLWIGTACTRKGSKYAPVHMISAVVLTIGFIGHILSVFGYIDLRISDINIVQLSTGIVAILLSFAPIDKIILLHEKNLESRHIEESLTRLSLTDELSKLYNRRFFNEKINNEVSSAHKNGKPLTLLLLDIDHFKRFNDTYGHQEGDKVISRIGKIILENIRHSDYACRYGGEEFAVILTETGKYTAEQYVAKRLHESLKNRVFIVTRDSKIFVTISIGIAQLQLDESAHSLIEHADEALYKAKALGRNRTIIYHGN